MSDPTTEKEPEGEAAPQGGDPNANAGAQETMGQQAEQAERDPAAGGLGAAPQPEPEPEPGSAEAQQQEREDFAEGVLKAKDGRLFQHIVDLPGGFALAINPGDALPAHVMLISREMFD